MENNAVSCPRARIISMDAKRYASVPLKAKLYLLQYRIFMGSLCNLDGASLRVDLHAVEKRLSELCEVLRSVELSLNVLARCPPHFGQNPSGVQHKLQLDQK